MGYKLKLEIEKRLVYSGAATLSNITGHDILCKLTKTIDQSDTTARKSYFNGAPVYARLFRASDFYNFSIDEDPTNSKNAFGFGNDAGLGDGYYGEATSSYMSTISGEKYFQVAQSSDHATSPSNDDPFDYKIRLNSTLYHSIDLPENLILEIYIGAPQAPADDYASLNRVISLAIPSSPSNVLFDTTYTVDCNLDAASWNNPIYLSNELVSTMGVPQLFPGVNYMDAPLYLSMRASASGSGTGITESGEVYFSPVVNSLRYQTIASVGNYIELEQSLIVTPPSSASQDVIDGIEIPDGLFGLNVTASPLTDGEWNTSFEGEVCSTGFSDAEGIYNSMGGGYFLNGSSNYSLPIATSGGANLTINGTEVFAIDDYFSSVDPALNSTSAPTPLEYVVNSVLFMSNSSSFEIDCNIDTILVSSTTAAGGVYGDLVCEVLCCLKKLQNRYIENKTKNPRIALLDKNKFDEAMILVGLFEWAIKCNSGQKKINKYYQNILSVTGCSGCAGCN